MHCKTSSSPYLLVGGTGISYIHLLASFVCPCIFFSGEPENFSQLLHFGEDFLETIVSVFFLLSAREGADSIIIDSIDQSAQVQQKPSWNVTDLN